MVKALARQEQEQQQRFEKEVACIKLCDTLRQTRVIQGQVERDADELGYQVLHKGLKTDQSPIRIKDEMTEDEKL